MSILEKTAKIEEIFASVQGEGPRVGVKQLFVRFCGCNLNCEYCDTKTSSERSKIYTVTELADVVNREKNVDSVSITGGEPLLHSDFLAELFEKINAPIYLETNGTLFEELKKVIKNTEYVSADIKLPSSSGHDCFEMHKKFLDVCVKNTAETFLKVVFNEKITEVEIKKTVELAKKNNFLIVLQPQMKGVELVPTSAVMKLVFEKFLEIYPNVRLIGQTHKFLGLE